MAVFVYRKWSKNASLLWNSYFSFEIFVFYCSFSYFIVIIIAFLKLLLLYRPSKDDLLDSLCKCNHLIFIWKTKSFFFVSFYSLAFNFSLIFSVHASYLPLWLLKKKNQNGYALFYIFLFYIICFFYEIEQSILFIYYNSL